MQVLLALVFVLVEGLREGSEVAKLGLGRVHLGHQPVLLVHQLVELLARPLEGARLVLELRPHALQLRIGTVFLRLDVGLFFVFLVFVLRARLGLLLARLEAHLFQLEGLRGCRALQLLEVRLELVELLLLRLDIGSHDITVALSVLDGAALLGAQLVELRELHGQLRQLCLLLAAQHLGEGDGDLVAQGRGLVLELADLLLGLAEVLFFRFHVRLEVLDLVRRGPDLPVVRRVCLIAARHFVLQLLELAHQARLRLFAGRDLLRELRLFAGRPFELGGLFGDALLEADARLRGVVVPALHGALARDLAPVHRHARQPVAPAHVGRDLERRAQERLSEHLEDRRLEAVLVLEARDNRLRVPHVLREVRHVRPQLAEREELHAPHLGFTEGVHKDGRDSIVLDHRVVQPRPRRLLDSRVVHVIALEDVDERPVVPSDLVVLDVLREEAERL
mmetsp:Transcript_41081/g.97328  ORF Transcript_41081/g.97328 Transcript_41081/m.97328 type:complete len:450 (+) Transcript_41081:1521-2870(+)